MTIETLIHDRLGDASEFAEDQMVLPFIGDAEFTDTLGREPSGEEEEVDALCRDALARFAEALRKAVLD